MPHLRDDSPYYVMHGRDQGCGAKVCPGPRSCCCPSHNSTKRGLCLGSSLVVPQRIVAVARHLQHDTDSLHAGRRKSELLRRRDGEFGSGIILMRLPAHKGQGARVNPLRKDMQVK